HHRPYLLRVVELRLDPKLRGRVDPSDVVQEAQLDAFRRLADYLQRQPMPFRLWLRKTAQERLLKVHRQHITAARRTVQREVVLPDRSSLRPAQQAPGAGPPPGGQVARREVVERARQALGQLPPADQEILLLRNLEGLPYEEIGCLLDIDPAAARK